MIEMIEIAEDTMMIKYYIDRKIWNKIKNKYTYRRHENESKNEKYVYSVDVDENTFFLVSVSHDNKNIYVLTSTDDDYQKIIKIIDDFGGVR